MESKPWKKLLRSNLVAIFQQDQTWIWFQCVTQDPEMVPQILGGMMMRTILILRDLVSLAVIDPESP